MSLPPAPETPLDLFVIGGGINGAGILRDAVGRGLTAGLCEMNDFASGTSSASTKLVHGGLRYLEHYEFRLVREALQEREVLLKAAPHIIWPLRFVLPHHAALRPAWMLRLGLFLYDHIGGRMTLPKSEGLKFGAEGIGAALKSDFARGFAYSDCWVDDARLVILNLRAAAAQGAHVYARHRCLSARRADGLWRITLQRPGGAGEIEVTARALVNAGGPWVNDVAGKAIGENAPKPVRLVKGSHIVVKRVYEGAHAFILQHADGRIVFLIPYERDFTLVGTTDVAVEGDPASAKCSQEEIRYLCDLASEYLAVPITPADVVWTYSGVRPLIDDGESEAAKVSRDYEFALEAPEGAAPLLSIYGGKITTFRRLAEEALERLARFFPGMGGDWTAGAVLPGGDFEAGDIAALQIEHGNRYPQIDPLLLRTLARRHGSLVPTILGDARNEADLGPHFGGHLFAREVEWLMREEWAASPEDVLLRRTKEWLHMDAAARTRLGQAMAGAAHRQAD